MRISMLSIGSMGDVAPYIVLGKELQNRGHTVTLCTFPDFQSSIEQAGLRFMPLLGNSKEFISAIMNGGDGVEFLHSVVSEIKNIIDPMMQDLMNACKDADAILSVFFGEVYQTIAEVYHIPYIQTQFFPMEKTGDWAISSAPFRKLGKAWNSFSYDLAYYLIGTIEKHFLDDWRVAHGLPKRKLSPHRHYVVNGHLIPVIYAVPPEVLPRPKEWGSNVHMTGYWRSEQQSYQPEEELVRFLEDPKPTVYIGFGSMNNNAMDETMQIIVQSLKLTGIRAVISAGWGGAKLEKSELVYPVNYISHDWLFPQVCGTVHHGGMGTVAASLYAGKPMLLIPFGGDQSFWGNQIERLGLGPRAIPCKKLTVKRFSHGLTELVTHPEYASNATAMQQKLKNTTPIQDAAKLVEDELNKWMHS